MRNGPETPATLTVPLDRPRGVGRGEIAAEKHTPRLAALPFDLVRYQLMYCSSRCRRRT
jgi:hypothetical protein